MAKVWKCCFVFCDDASDDREALSDSQRLKQELTQLGHVLDIVAWGDKKIQWTDYDLVLPLQVYDYPLHYEGFLKWLQTLETAGVNILNPLSVLRWNIDKRYLLQLENRGVTIPVTTLYKQRNSNFPCLGDIMKKNQWADAIIKPVIGGDSLGVKRVMRDVNTAEAQTHFEDLLRKGDAFLQEYVDAMSSSGEICCVFINEDFSHAIMKVPHVAQDIAKGISTQVIKPSERVISAAKRAIDVSKMLIPYNQNILYARVDLCDDKTRNSIIVNEVEMLEPSLYLETEDKAAKALARGVVDYLNIVASNTSPSIEKGDTLRQNLFEKN